MKSYVAHYKNKYPQGRVIASESAIDVFCAGGEHRVALRKNGAGQWLDHSEELGCVDKHCLAPIPKDARVHKLQKDGKLGLDELAQERKAKASDFVRGGKVLSIAELEKAEGFVFEADGHVKSRPEQAKA